MFVVIILSVTLISCSVAFFLVRFIPRLRYLPSGLLLVAGLCFLLSTLGTMPNRGFGDFLAASDLTKLATIIIGTTFILVSGFTFLVSFLMHKRVVKREKRHSIVNTTRRFES